MQRPVSQQVGHNNLVEVVANDSRYSRAG